MRRRFLPFVLLVLLSACSTPSRGSGGQLQPVVVARIEIDNTWNINKVWIYANGRKIASVFPGETRCVKFPAEMVGRGITLSVRGLERTAHAMMPIQVTATTPYWRLGFSNFYWRDIHHAAPARSCRGS